MRWKRTARVTPGIPTASMADIAFLLVIFFLATTIFRLDSGLTVERPRAEVGRKGQPQQTLVVVLDASGGLLIDGQAAELGAIEPAVRARLAAEPSLVVSLRIDRAVPYRKVHSLFEELKAAGARNANLAVEREESAP